MCPKRRPLHYWTKEPLWWLGVCGLILGVSESWAQDRCQADPGCRQLTVEASQLATDKRCEPAIALFEKAYAQSSEPRLLLNIGRCHYRLGQPQKALDKYEEFRRLRPKTDAETNSRLGQFVAEAKLAILSAEQEQAKAAAAKAASAEVEPPPAPLQPELAERRVLGRPLWRVVVSAAAVGVGGTLLGLGIGALAAHGQCAVPSPNMPGQCGAENSPDGMQRFALIDGIAGGVPLLVSGGLLIAGGITLFVWPAPKPKASAWAVPTPSAPRLLLYSDSPP